MLRFLSDAVKVSIIALTGYITHLNGSFTVWLAIMLTIGVMVAFQPARTAKEHEE